MPPEENVFPSGGDHRVEHPGGDGIHRDDSHRERGDRQDDELEEFRDDDAHHPSLHGVDRREAHEYDCVGIGGPVPGEEYLREFPDPLEPVRKESDHAHEGENHDDDMGELGPGARPEPGLDPFRSRHHLRPPEPDGQIDHQEYLVEHRPDPGEPHALQPVDEQDVDKPHGAGDVKHPGSIRHAEHPPGERIRAEEIGVDVLDRPPGDKETDDDHEDEIRYDDADIDQVYFHRDRSVERAGKNCSFILINDATRSSAWRGLFLRLTGKRGAGLYQKDNNLWN